MNTVLRLLVVSLLVAISAACATTSGSGGGSMIVDAPRKYLEAVITGKVTHNGVGISGVALEVKNHNTFGVTDAKGNFTLNVKTMTRLGINRMRVQVEARIQGYRTRTRGVYIEQGGTALLDIELLPF